MWFSTGFSSQTCIFYCQVSVAGSLSNCIIFEHLSKASIWPWISTCNGNDCDNSHCVIVMFSKTTCSRAINVWKAWQVTWIHCVVLFLCYESRNSFLFIECPSICSNPNGNDFVGLTVLDQFCLIFRVVCIDIVSLWLVLNARVKWASQVFSIYDYSTWSVLYIVKFLFLISIP